MTPLAACQFCGFAEIDMLEKAMEGQFFACCPECEATGPTWETANGAANLWNERNPLMWDEGGICEGQS